MKTITLTCLLLLGAIMTKASTDDVFVYPNPSHDQIYVQIPDSITGITVIRVRDLAGRVVYRFERSLDGYEFRKTLIPVVDLPNGAYLLEISAGERAFQTEFIKD